MSKEILKIRPPRIAQGFVLLAVLLHWATPLGVALFSNRLLGTLTLSAGLLTMLAGWRLFKLRSTAICPTDIPSVLITDGIYRFTRNPMYLGLFGILLGLAIMVGTLPFYAAAIAYLVVMNEVFCPDEEQRLELLFVGDFRAYSARVRRWL